MFERITVIAILLVAGGYLLRRLFKPGGAGCGCGCDCSSQSRDKTCSGGQLDELRPLENKAKQCCGRHS